MAIDKQKRLLVPKDLREKSELETISIFYSKEEELFFVISAEETEPDNAFFLGKRKLDAKGRFVVPKEIIGWHDQPKDFLVVKKKGRIYLIPKF